MRRQTTFVVLLLTAHVASWAATVKPAEGDKFVLDNKHFRLVVNPAHGGRVCEFLVKRSKEQLVFSPESAGMFIDHFWQHVWPGEFSRATYEAKPVSTGTRAGVVLRRLSTGIGRDKKLVPLCSDILVEKTIVLAGDARYVTCDVTLTNKGTASKFPGYWVQHVFWAGADKKNDVYIRPSVRTPDVTTPDERGRDWVRDFNQGWSATLDRAKKTGLVFLMDYNYVHLLYNCQPSCTSEWRYRRVFIPKGKSWQTRHYTVYVDGLTDVGFASEEFIAAVRAKPLGKKLRIEHQVVGSVKEVRSVRLKTSVISTIGKPATHTLKEVTISDIGPDLRKAVVVDDQPMGDPRVVRVDAVVALADGKTVTHRYEHFYVGSYGYGRNIQMDMETPVYAAPRPKQQVTFLKPKHIRKKRNHYPVVFMAKGLFADYFRITEQVTDLMRSHRSTLDVGHLSVSSVTGATLSDFPLDYDRIMAYDVVVLANIPAAAALEDMGMEVLSDFVRHGGGLLVLGGSHSFGQTKLKGTRLAEMLPVHVTDTPDIVRLKDGRLAAPDPNDPILMMVDLAPPVWCYYVHDVKPKKGARVVVTAGGKPLLVVGEYGQGKVAAVLATPFGQPQPGQTPFWKWDGWYYLVRNVLNHVWKR